MPDPLLQTVLILQMLSPQLAFGEIEMVTSVKFPPPKFCETSFCARFVVLRKTKVLGTVECLYRSIPTSKLPARRVSSR